tara:strand:- start:614 stop:1219 length:606 start_codon:yes stop_codon:yes gene_type:complete
VRFGFLCFSFFVLIFSEGQTFAKLPQSPDLAKPGNPIIYGGLSVGDSREEVLSTLRKNGFIQIYEEKSAGVVKSAVRWDEIRYELASKLIDDKLALCLIEGNKGWQDFHYDDVVSKEWKNLRERVINAYGKPSKSRNFPEYFDIPVNDLGGTVTDIWNLTDRTLMLSVRKYEAKDCCTDQILEFSCCTLLIKPHVKEVLLK